MLPVFELAEQKIRKDEILPRHVHLNWTTYDDNCESSLATISAVNGFTSDCAHVQFGPICDYSLGKHLRAVTNFLHLKSMETRARNLLLRLLKHLPYLRKPIFWPNIIPRNGR